MRRKRSALLTQTSAKPLSARVTCFRFHAPAMSAKAMASAARRFARRRIAIAPAMSAAWTADRQSSSIAANVASGARPNNCERNSRSRTARRARNGLLPKAARKSGNISAAGVNPSSPSASASSVRSARAGSKGRGILAGTGKSVMPHSRRNRSPLRGITSPRVAVPDLERAGGRPRGENGSPRANPVRCPRAGTGRHEDARRRRPD